MALRHEMVSQGNVLFRYRGVLPILIVIPALLIRIFGDADAWMAPYTEWVNWCAYAIALLGLFLRFIVVGYAPPRTSGRNTEEQIADTLSSTGMYSVVRHPLYVGNFLMWLGPALLTYNTGFVLLFILMYWLYYERIMMAEEDFLQHKFGTAYETWAAGRPAFIPAFSRWVPYAQPFRFYKALYQEKTGFLWLNLIFWLFIGFPAHSLLELVYRQQVWSALFGFSLLLYIALKITRKKEA